MASLFILNWIFMTGNTLKFDSIFTNDQMRMKKGDPKLCN